MFATLEFLFGVPLFKGTGLASLWGALVSLPAGLLLIWVDLGHLERIWRVYLQPNWLSVMTQMVWGYTVFGLLILGAVWLALKQRRGTGLKTVMAAGLVLSI